MTFARSLAAAAFALIPLAPVAEAATVNATGNVTNNVIFGSGVTNGAFTGVTCGGLELALACDIIIASETAQFTDSHVKNLKIAIGKGSVTTGLARRVGYNKALELCLLGEFIDGNEAYRIGLANKVTAPGKLLEDARTMATKIAGMREEAVQVTKLACRTAEDTDLNGSWENADELLDWMKEDPEYQGLQSVTTEWSSRKR